MSEGVDLFLKAIEMVDVKNSTIKHRSDKKYQQLSKTNV